MSEIDHETVRNGLAEHLPRLWRYALVLSRDHATAEDLVQATCVRALERQAQFRAGTNLRAWLFTILSSIWKNQIRAERVRAGAGFVDPEQALVADGLGEMETNNLLRRVLMEVERLPEAQRQTLTLVYAEGFTYREAARILDVPIGTVMSRLATARSMLAGLNEPQSAAPRKEDDERE